MSTSAAPPRSLLLTGARTHNLKGISCAIPHGRVTVVTGPSGAGKSSLVFDTLFAEGQRRFVESMSTYAQQFIQQLERPPLDSLEHLLPAVALQAGNPIRNARATVGTLTEAHDLLRLLFTYLGEVLCANGCGPTRAFTAESAAAALVGGLAGADFLLVAPLARPRERADDKLQELVRQGYFRLWRDGEIARVSPGDPWPADADPLPLLLGRFRAAAADSRLADAVEEGFRLARGRLLAIPAAGGASGKPGKPVQLAEELGCPVCGEAARRPVAALFSFNSPLGACSDCSGFGRIIGIDRQRVVPDPGKSLRERPFAPWNTPSYEEHYAPLLQACKQAGVPLDVPWRELPEAVREWIWSGPNGAAPRRRWRRPRSFLGLSAFFAWLETRTYRVHVRVLLARYRAYHRCPTCGGARLQPEALRVRLRGRTLPELLALSIEELRRWLGEQQWSDAERARGDHLLESLARRLEVLHQVGLDYLTLDRAGRTLSGGEAQRIQLAAALGSGLTGTLYALDEPDHRPPRARQPPPAGAAARPLGARQHGGGGGARPGRDPRRRPPARARARRRRGGRQPRLFRHAARAAARVLFWGCAGRHAHRAPPAQERRPPRAPPRGAAPAGARRDSPRAAVRQSSMDRDRRRLGAQPARRRRALPARCPGRGHRRLGLGQVDARRGRPLRGRAGAARRAGCRARESAASFAGSTRWPRSCSSTSGRWGARRAATRSPPSAPTTSCASSSPAHPKRSRAGSAPATSRSTSTSAAARTAAAPARRRSTCSSSAPWKWSASAARAAASAPRCWRCACAAGTSPRRWR